MAKNEAKLYTLLSAGSLKKDSEQTRLRFYQGQDKAETRAKIRVNSHELVKNERHLEERRRVQLFISDSICITNLLV